MSFFTKRHENEDREFRESLERDTGLSAAEVYAGCYEGLGDSLSVPAVSVEGNSLRLSNGLTIGINH